MRVTHHFTERAKKRVGLAKKSSESLLQKALDMGLYYEDFCNRPNFQKYLKRTIRNDCVAIIFNRYIIISSRNQVGITILNLPREFYSTVYSVKKLKRGTGLNEQGKYNQTKGVI